MKSIWKYIIPIENVFELEMPEGARVLSVQVQSSFPTIWALVNPDAPKIMQQFNLYGTGQPIDGYEGHFIGTFQTNGGLFVWHLFQSPMTTSTA